MSINIDVEFDEISGDISDKELIKEVISRIGHGIPEQLIRDLKRAMDLPENEIYFEMKTLEDQMKLEHIHKIFNKYTAAQLEQLIPEI